jgi:HSP20 family protein
MSNEKNELSLFHNNDFGLFPRGFFSNFMNDGFWDGFRFGGFKADVRETKDAYIIDAEMPGVDKKDVSIDIDENMLTVSANIDESKEQKDDYGRYLRRERRTGSFKRSFSLENVRANEIKAEMNNGILSITCPKKAETISRSRRIEIQ